MGERIVMDNLDFFFLGIVAARTFDISLEKAKSMRFQVIPPFAPWIYRLPISNLQTYPYEISVGYEDIKLMLVSVGDKSFRVGYSKQQNVMLVAFQDKK